MDRIPKPGELYRHVKNTLYQVIGVAEHTETGERLVIYQALYGTFGIYAKPLAMFTEEVNHEKYPDVAQRYWFEKVDGGMVQAAEPEKVQKQAAETASVCENREEKSLSPLLLPFVEAEDYNEKLEILCAMRGKISQEELDIMYIALDLPKRDGDTEEQLHAIEQYLIMQKRFDGARLR